MTVTGAWAGSAAAHAWPLIGRDEELEQISTSGPTARVQRSPSSPRQAWESQGWPERPSRPRTRAGAIVSWVQGTRSAAAVPLAACAELLPPDARADDQLLQLQRTARTLREHAEGRPIVIGVDDAQRLDPASAALILQLAINGTAFVLATIRSAEPCPDAVQSLWKDAGAERIELRAAVRSQHGELIEAVLGGPGRAARLQLDLRHLAGQRALHARAPHSGACRRTRSSTSTATGDSLSAQLRASP